MTRQIHDFVVVGAGSAGCVLANRLVRAGYTVLLLEAGPPDNSLFVRMPATFVRVIGTARSWLYETGPQQGAAGRTLFVPQGRTLGGGSSLNAMVYIRGLPQDYDGWRDQGCPGWGWQEVLPVFRRSECNQRLSNEYHGVEGPLPVSDARFRHPLSYAFIQAAQETGLAYNDDFNGARQDGIGFYQTTTHAGERASTARAYLAPIRDDVRLTRVTGALVQRLTFQGNEVRGVVWRTEGGALIEAGARHEVILSAGALATPKILQLSGIGPGAQLQSLGIAVTQDLPGVGENYQDHLEVPVCARARDPISLFGQDKGLAALSHGAQWLLWRSGLLTSNVVECGGFVDTSGSGRPDIQFHVLPVLVGDVDRAPIDGHGMTLNPCFLHPKSRGTVRLRSADAQAPILFDGGYLGAQEDVDTLVRGVKLARRILRAPSLQKLVSEELAPSREEAVSDELLADYVRARAKTVYHPSGTCRMGSDDLAVVDPQLRVRGVGRLRVADASVMPAIPGGNTNAPVIMIAERCADFVLAALR